MTLSSLIARVEGLSGPCRETELAIWRLVDPRAPEMEAANRSPLPWMHCYTESIDAALKLVPEGMIWGLANCGVSDPVPDMQRATATVGQANDTSPPIEAATPAIALTAACLRARDRISTVPAANRKGE